MIYKNPAVYIIANKPNGTIYTGVTSNLIQRVYQHKHGFVPGFTKKYNCILLVYYELMDGMVAAIEREKQIKGGSRNAKLALTKSVNPNWQDLYQKII
jgi:predicted GIY-YIG superfamily endonuclease